MRASDVVVSLLEARQRVGRWPEVTLPLRLSHEDILPAPSALCGRREPCAARSVRIHGRAFRVVAALGSERLASRQLQTINGVLATLQFEPAHAFSRTG